MNTRRDIRRAGTADMPALLPMLRDFNAAERIPWREAAVVPALTRLLQDTTLGFVLLADAGQGALGYVVVTFGYDLEFAGRDAFVTELFVQPTARGAGWGGRLLRAAEAEARAADVRALHLQVHADNAPALALYRRHGFATSPRLFLSKRLAR